MPCGKATRVSLRNHERNAVLRFRLGLDWNKMIHLFLCKKMMDLFCFPLCFSVEEVLFVEKSSFKTGWGKKRGGLDWNQFHVSV